MAPSNPTLLATISDGGVGAHSYTTPSFSPASDVLLVVAMHIDYDIGTFHVQPTITTTLSNVGSWSFVEGDNGLSFGDYLLFAYAKVTGTPGTGTLTFDFGSGNDRDALLAKVYSVTGHDTTTPVTANTATATDQSGAQTSAAATFGSTPAADSLVMVLTGLIVGQNTGHESQTPRAGYTELDDWGAYNSTYTFAIDAETQYLNGSATTSISSTWVVGRSWIILGIEIAAAGGGGGGLPALEVLTRHGTPVVVSSASATANAAPTTGVTVNKPANVQNRDVLYAFVSKTNYANTASFTCSGWTEVSSGTRGTTTGNDRHTVVLRKVITDAGSEPSTYTFVTTSSTTSTMCATIVNVQGADITTPEDIAVGAPTFASNDATPASRDATSVTENALVLNYCQLSLATVALRTWGVPSGYTGNAGNADCGLAANSLNNQQGVAWKTLGAAGSTAGTNVWTHTADEATAENSTVVVLVRPANVSLSPPKPTRRSVRSLLMR